jgi:WD40 repeat protein
MVPTSIERITPDGKRIVTASVDETARVWDAENGHRLFTFSGRTGYVYDAAFSPDGKRIVTSSSDKTVRLWDAENGHPLATFGHTGEVFKAAFSPDGKRIVTASEDGTARVYIGSFNELFKRGEKLVPKGSDR